MTETGNGTSSTREYVQCPACGGHTASGNHVGGLACSGTFSTHREPGAGEIYADLRQLIADYGDDERGVIALMPFGASLDQLFHEKYGLELPGG